MRKYLNKKMLRNIILFIALIVFTYWMIFRKQDMNKLYALFKNSDKKYIIIGLITMFFYFVMEAYNIKSILKIFGNKVSFFKSLKYTFIGFFFSAITPASSGGQPMEIYCMSKENIPVANGTIALLMELCGYHISSIIIGIVCAIVNYNLLKDGLIWLFIIGLLLNSIVLCIIMIGIFSKKLTKKLVNFVVKILEIFKIKNIEEKRKTIMDALYEYNKSALFIKNNKKEIFKSIIRVFFQVAFYYCVPFFVYKSFGYNSYNILQIFSLQAILSTSVSCLPLPGSIGISETIFLSLFVPVFESSIRGAVLLSRGITFYIYVLISLVIVIINSVKIKRMEK